MYKFLLRLDPERSQSGQCRRCVNLKGVLKRDVVTMAKPTVELQIPSIRGYEKVAMTVAAELARLEGAGNEAAMNLATAVSEACLNAMEHAHGYDSRLPVKLSFRTGPGSLEVDIADAGPPFTFPVPAPSMQNKIEGDEAPRGWGLFLIRNLVNKVEVRRLPDGNMLRLTIEFTRR
ncbi:MAG: Serine-protein kinase RsbW [Pelotomaculum sp. PtaB.Bin013]|uniref:ATP-binding protein n=1 Tax=Pelotomaculum isophthalicicum JI TaxID=947010 RepID=A0A9X4JUJ8_9FIRM|nr:ATP-binding protein [Pelotomaculum isophthalicicum]MDF9409400.1 ATP-binding protein [Pelotomaculum isophthalicicum JI]OPX91758.1 MAG: Serine-protein kinase RsbW [Pelotomaculum sp. PtaB.Bin013]